MKVLEVELRCAELPLVAPLRAAHGSTSVRRVVLVLARTEAGDGWGECAALAEPTYTSEHAAGALAVMRDHLVPRLLALDELELDGTGEALAGVRGHRMAKAALEMAILDAGLRAEGRSLATHLGAVHEVVPAGASLGLTDDPAALVEEASGLLASGYRRLKVKVRPGWDHVPLAALRAIGSDVTLVADGNGAYGRGDLDCLVALDELGLAALEQPLAPDDLIGHAELARRAATPIALDESISSAAGAETALALGACTAVSVKAGRVGGLREAVAVVERCQAAAARAWCGGMLETGLGRAAALVVAALPGITEAGDLGPSDRYLAPDLTEPFVLTDGDLPPDPAAAEVAVEVVTGEPGDGSAAVDVAAGDRAVAV
ncbi:MAG TPA: o-succinylbenzoate synthase, partial [Acidimicrobiales bacterium]|nr:o-succinylbenzoate synthase [Acidimicrobiales bacterium]